MVPTPTNSEDRAGRSPRTGCRHAAGSQLLLPIVTFASGTYEDIERSAHMLLKLKALSSSYVHVPGTKREAGREDGDSEWKTIGHPARVMGCELDVDGRRDGVREGNEDGTSSFKRSPFSAIFEKNSCSTWTTNENRKYGTGKSLDTLDELVEITSKRKSAGFPSIHLTRHRTQARQSGVPRHADLSLVEEPPERRIRQVLSPGRVMGCKPYEILRATGSLEDTTLSQERMYRDGSRRGREVWYCCVNAKRKIPPTRNAPEHSNPFLFSPEKTNTLRTPHASTPSRVVSCTRKPKEYTTPGPRPEANYVREGKGVGMSAWHAGRRGNASAERIYDEDAHGMQMIRYFDGTACEGYWRRWSRAQGSTFGESAPYPGSSLQLGP
ncbi:uncharacterized protein EV420DRAFT_1484594 [Desarmillaria tabescens]|uniref:Uncharacterized protein n=1 Tax=Armillaria tabescens TaxID=1929756 RepID=A0AA39JLE7_ARMTA|nr:uncharacterized protein EV420DRAFT_1484594 [Desarmillaria tabescens]KAK0444629.1 hypothetical protein EV420DRAFT_1484594 [Desarmillaria tabescens]